jgi:hypothetical protein
MNKKISKYEKIQIIILLMKENGCYESWGLGIDFDLIGEVIGYINNQDITGISSTEVFLQDNSKIPLVNCTNDILDRILKCLKNL